MATCPICKKKLTYWQLHPLSLYNVKFLTKCSCGTNIKVKHWILWNIFMMFIGVGSIFLMFWFIMNFNFSRELIITLWLLFIFVSPPLFLQFATFKKAY